MDWGHFKSYNVTLILVSVNFLLHFCDLKMCILKSELYFFNFSMGPSYDLAHFLFPPCENLETEPNHREDLLKNSKLF